MKETLKYLLWVTLVSLAPVLVLLVSYLGRLEALAGNFTRQFPHKYTDLKSFDLKYNSYYIAGNINDDIYLGNLTTTPRVLKINTALTDTATTSIYIQKDKMLTTNYRITLEDKNFYLGYGKEHLIYKGNCTDWIARPSKIFSPYFHDAIPINGSSIIYCYVNAKTKMNSLRKESANGVRVENDRILEKQVDGIFCTTGNLEYNQNLNVLTYLYCYRNQILVLDTNLNLIKKIKTIDGIDTARFEVSKINSNGKQVITKPTILVNPKCATYKQYLLVNSKIMGKGEDDREFEYSTVIDIYDINKGSYLYSFYLPNNKKINISQIKVINGDVYTISGHFLNKFKITLPQ